MPTLDQHQSTGVTKLLLLGESGSGKTGALGSLANAGYNLRILDFDNGLDILRHVVKPDRLSTVVFETLTDKRKGTAGKVIVDGLPKAFTRAMQLLDKWKEPDLGPITSWGEQDILVVDSLSFAAKAAFNYVVSVAGRAMTDPWQQDYGEAQRMIEGMLALLFSDSVRCNVIVNSHVQYIGGEEAVMKGLPMAIGKALSPVIPRYFNSMLLAEVKGNERIIRTQSRGLIELKTPLKPGTLSATIPLDSGLATFFEAVRKTK